MSEGLEERLSTSLQLIAGTVEDDIAVPADLELQVRRHRRHARSVRRWSSLGIAAAIVATVAGAALLHGAAGHGGIRVETSPTTSSPPVADALQPGTVMLSARGKYVVSLDASGTRNATMAGPTVGDIVYARATADHHQIWYLSQKNGPKACGEVVREDVDAGTSRIVTQAQTFDVSPDGSRLALYGSGDLARGHCVPVGKAKAGGGRVVVVDVASGKSSAVALGNVTSLRFSPDGSFLVAVNCAAACSGYTRIDVPTVLGGSLGTYTSPEGYSTRVVFSASVAFGPDGLYTLEAAGSKASAKGTSIRRTDRVERIDAATFGFAVPVFTGASQWNVTQVVPTAHAVYVVAAPVRHADATGLYRIERGRLVGVRALPGAGTLTAVTPLAGN